MVGRRTENDESGQVLVLGPEPVVTHEPSDGRPTLDVAGVHHQHRGFMVRDVGVHRPNDADVVDAGADVRKSSLTSRPLFP